MERWKSAGLMVSRWMARYLDAILLAFWLMEFIIENLCLGSTAASWFYRVGI